MNKHNAGAFTVENFLTTARMLAGFAVLGTLLWLVAKWFSMAF